MSLLIKKYKYIKLKKLIFFNKKKLGICRLGSHCLATPSQ
jgi:hypothetical protein